MMKQLPAIMLALLCTALSLVLAISFGAVDIHLTQIVNSELSQLEEKIIWQLRAPRVLLAFVAGAGLAMSGFVLQTVTRNPLADPYLFGISSGATLGVVLLLSVGVAFSGFMLSLAAFIGSLMSVLLLMAVAISRISRQVETLLLAGVAISFLFGAITSLLLYWSDPQAITAILFWNLGSFSRANWDNLLLPLLIVTLSLIFLMFSRRGLSALLIGDETATTLGIKVKQYRFIMLAISSLITASIVSVAGGIGFVGLMIPHIVRQFATNSNSLILTALFGGMFMVWVDVLARTLIEAQELPVGIITAALGSVFFLTLLYHRSHKGITR